MKPGLTFRRFTDHKRIRNEFRLNMENSPQNIGAYTDIFAVYVSGAESGGGNASLSRRRSDRSSVTDGRADGQTRR